MTDVRNSRQASLAQIRRAFMVESGPSAFRVALAQSRRSFMSSRRQMPASLSRSRLLIERQFLTGAASRSTSRALNLRLPILRSLEEYRRCRTGNRAAAVG